jgi:hypothetical protein
MAAEEKVSPPRSWGRSTVQTACPLDCPDSCSLAVTVERGKIVAIEAGAAAPSTGGYICGKVRGFDKRVYGQDRLLHPMVRRGPKGNAAFERTTWDEALDLIAARMRDAEALHGAESVLPYYYGGSNGLLTSDLEDARFFRRFGASRLARTFCAAPTGAAAAALYGRMPGVAYEDYAAARLIVVWGCNASASGMDCPNDRYVNDEKICQAVVGMLARVGLKVNLLAQTRTKYFEKILSRNTTFSLLGWQPLSYDVHSTLQDAINTPKDKVGTYNVGSFSNAKIDELTNAIEVEVDPAKRQALIVEALTIHKDEIGHIPLHQAGLAWGVRKGTNVVLRNDDSLELKWVKMD